MSDEKWVLMLVYNDGKIGYSSDVYETYDDAQRVQYAVGDLKRMCGHFMFDKLLWAEPVSETAALQDISEHPDRRRM